MLACINCYTTGFNEQNIRVLGSLSDSILDFFLCFFFPLCVCVGKRYRMIFHVIDAIAMVETCDYTLPSRIDENNK